LISVITAAPAVAIAPSIKSPVPLTVPTIPAICCSIP